MCRRCVPGTVTVVADEVTWRVAGKQVQEQLDASGATAGEPFLFPAGTFVRADYANVERLRTPSRAPGAIPVAVGSGTINDLTKLAASPPGPALHGGRDRGLDGRLHGVRGVDHPRGLQADVRLPRARGRARRPRRDRRSAPPG